MSHVIVGVWAIEARYPDRPRVDRGTLLFHENGTASMAFADHAAHAVWQATGDRNATLLGTRPVGPNEGFVGWFTFRANATVSDDGRGIQLGATESRPRPDGSLVEQQMTLSGTRLTVE